jgi:hypothetical protein
MNSPSDQNIFNSIDPTKLEPKPKNPLPFPLENFDEEIGIAFGHMDLILQKIKAAKHNPINDTPAKKRRLKSLQYKCTTCMQLIKEISTSVQDLWF